MKRKIFIFLILIVSMVTMVSARCDFSGQIPPHSITIGGNGQGVTIHYYKYARSSVISGGCQHEYFEGDVWVIYHSSSATKSYCFHTQGGQIQYCYDY